MLLKDRYREMLTNIFSTVSTPIEVWAFGSRVSGAAHSGSDLDLVVVSSDRKRLPAKVLADLRCNITESNVPILVELFDWARLPDNMQQYIAKRYEVMFSNVSTSVCEPPATYGQDEASPGLSTKQ